MFIPLIEWPYTVRYKEAGSRPACERFVPDRMCAGTPRSFLKSLTRLRCTMSRLANSTVVIGHIPSFVLHP